MQIKINFPKDDVHINNLAFVKALMIKNVIENLNLTYDEKEKLRKEILEYLKKSWKEINTRVRITQKKRSIHEKEN